MNYVLLTAAGHGTRMKLDIPKQFVHVNDKPIIVYTMEAFQKHPAIDGIIVVCLNDWKEVLRSYAKQYNITKLKGIVSGGDTGQESIRAGLNELKNMLTEDDTIIVHDGNRPLVSTEVISDSLATYKKYGSAVAVIPCTEVVFESEDGKTSTVSTDREKLFRTQTPHTYRFSDLWEAHQEAEKLGITNTAASCILMKELGKTTYFSNGSVENFKITTMEDLGIFKALLKAKKEMNQ